MKRALLLIVFSMSLIAGAQCNLNINLSYRPLICAWLTRDSVSVSVNAGVSPYDYSWSNGSHDSIGLLFPGSFSVTVTDANNCTASASGFFQRAPDIFATSILYTDYCDTPFYGKLVIEPIGGILPYSYEVIRTDSQQHFAPDSANIFLHLLPGSYSWWVWDSIGCKKGNAFFIPDSGICVGIAEARMFEVRLFPNPASSYLTIESESLPLQTSFQLFDITGRMILQQELRERTERIDVRAVSNGMYLYNVVSKRDKIGSGKVIIEGLFSLP
jgi:hypothetical protein